MTANRTLAAILVAALVCATSPAARAQEGTPPPPAQGGEKKIQETPAAAPVTPVDLTDLLAHLYRPVGAGLRDESFVFRHQAFENAAFPFRKTRFAFFFQAPDRWKLEVRNLHEAHALLGPRLVELMSWIHRFVGGVSILDEALRADRVVSVSREGEFLRVISRPGEKDATITLRFQEKGGRYYLHRAQSRKLGTVRLRWGTVGGVEVVTALEINNPLTALGPWTLACEEHRVNQGLDASIFEKR